MFASVVRFWGCLSLMHACRLRPYRYERSAQGLAAGVARATHRLDLTTGSAAPCILLGMDQREACCGQGGGLLLDLGDRAPPTLDF